MKSYVKWKDLKMNVKKKKKLEKKKKQTTN